MHQRWWASSPPSPRLPSHCRCRSATSRHHKSATKRERAVRRSRFRHLVAVVVLAAPLSAMGEAEEKARRAEGRERKNVHKVAQPRGEEMRILPVAAGPSSPTRHRCHRFAAEASLTIVDTD
ncbi:uncharacterized protein DS421_15g512280 [Arachis hypogaea]|nr:uncharacterized protein DS421_15g512280 [Arachis hypogaea]